MCKYLWWWLLHGSWSLCKMLTYMHPMCVSYELYILCKRIAIAKWWMSNNMRSRVSYVIKPYAFDGESSMAWLGLALALALAFAMGFQMLCTCTMNSMFLNTITVHALLLDLVLHLVSGRRTDHCHTLWRIQNANARPTDRPPPKTSSSNELIKQISQHNVEWHIFNFRPTRFPEILLLLLLLWMASTRNLSYLFKFVCTTKYNHKERTKLMVSSRALHKMWCSMWECDTFSECWSSICAWLAFV